MNKFLNYFLASLFISFIGSVIFSTHGYTLVADLLNAYTLFTFLTLGVVAIIFGDKLDRLQRSNNPKIA